MYDMMVPIPGGDIAMRDDRTSTSWRVDVSPFLLGRHPVTVSHYDGVEGEAPSHVDIDSHPAVNVSWYDAISFCNRLSRQAGFDPCYETSDDGEHVDCDWEANGYRLPTEAEWQYACKAGTAGYRYGDLDRIGWYEGNSGGRIRAVGKKAANPWGLYDMLGNVWEWCWDVYDPEVYGPYRVFRGGGWADEARSCGATCRRRSHPTFRIDDLGFRLARSRT